MKKVLAILLTLCMALALVACASGTTDTNTQTHSTDKTDTNTSTDTGSDTTTTSTTGGVDDGVFKIGIYSYIAGTPLNVEMPIAFEVAMNKYNNEINGEKIELVYYDTQNDPSEAVTGAQYLIGEGCDAVIGSFQSSDVVAAYPLLEEAHIFNMMEGTSGSIVTDDQVYSFRGSFNANLSVYNCAQVCLDFGYENIAIFYGQDEASASVYEMADAAFKDAGLNVVATETGSANDTDFSSQCMKIVNSNPDIVYCACQNGGVNFIKQLREYGYNGIILSKDEWMATFAETVGQKNSDYIMSVAPYTTYPDLDAAVAAGASDNIMEFLNSYVAISGGDLPTMSNTYRFYDGMITVLESATRAGVNYDSDKLVEACLTINDLEGCSGTIDYTQGDREPAHTFAKFMYIDGASISLDTWKENGGYDAFLAATGRAK